MRIALGSSTRRIQAGLVLLALLISGGAVRLFDIQALDAGAYAARAADRLEYTVPIHPARGVLTDRDGLVLARSETAVNVTADPTHTAADASRIAVLLAEHLGGEPGDYWKKLTTPDTQFVYLKKKVPSAVYQRLAVDLQDAGLYGVFRETNPIRVYPNGSVAAPIVGFVNGENAGAAGVELSMNAELQGVAGREMYQRDSQGNKLPLGSSEVTPAVNGTNYQLTIDSDLQWMTERRLAAAVDKAGAKTGTATVLNARTGEILAMANYPNFDSSDPGKADPDDLSNRAVQQALEPGSMQKVLTFAALIDAGTITPSTKVTVPSRIKSGDGYVKDSEDLGGSRLTAAGVLAKSSNIGTILLSRNLAQATWVDYMKKFGLGTKTGVELPGESAGSLPRAPMADYSYDQVVFGQGLSTTSVQFAAAVAAAVNGGVYHQPTLIKSATDNEGNPIALPEKETHRVISEETSATIRDLMETDTGPGGTASDNLLEGYRTGAKTATAERYDEKTRGYLGYTAGFVGAAPIDDPQIVTVVQIDQPTRGHYGSTLAGPVFTDVTQLALQRYGVKPSTSKPVHLPIEW